MARGNPLQGIFNTARSMGINPVNMAVNAMSAQNPMMGALAQFAMNYRNKSPNELKQMIVAEIQKNGGMSNEQISQLVDTAKRFGVSDSQINEAMTIFRDNPDLIKK